MPAFAAVILVIGAWMTVIARGTHAAAATDFPVRPIRLIASGVGGTGDFASRLIGPHLASRLGQPVVVDNRPGGAIPGQILVGEHPKRVRSDDQE